MKESNLKPKNQPNVIKNIALIGHMGCGKSLLGKLIAKKLDFEHIDTDKLIEKKTKCKIDDIFNNQGEEKFRIIEEKTILSITNKKNLVLSLGGGSILNKKIRNYLKDNFLTIFLNVNLKLLVNRLQNSSKRPLLLNTNIKKKIKELDANRRKYYLLADIKIYNNKSPEDTLSQVLKIIKNI